MLTVQCPGEGLKTVQCHWAIFRSRDKRAANLINVGPQPLDLLTDATLDKFPLCQYFFILKVGIIACISQSIVKSKIANGQENTW